MGRRVCQTARMNRAELLARQNPKGADMTQPYVLFRGQPLADGDVVEQICTPRGDVVVAPSGNEAEQVRAGRYIMDRWRHALSVLAKS